MKVEICETAGRENDDNYDDNTDDNKYDNEDDNEDDNDDDLMLKGGGERWQWWRWARKPRS